MTKAFGAGPKFFVIVTGRGLQVDEQFSVDVGAPAPGSGSDWTVRCSDLLRGAFAQVAAIYRDPTDVRCPTA
jgi:hypothetical protein